MDVVTQSNQVKQEDVLRVVGMLLDWFKKNALGAEAREEHKERPELHRVQRRLGSCGRMNPLMIAGFYS